MIESIQPNSCPFIILCPLDCNLQDDSLADSADSVDVEAELGVKSEVVESECLPDNDVAATSSTGIGKHTFGHSCKISSHAHAVTFLSLWV